MSEYALSIAFFSLSAIGVLSKVWQWDGSQNHLRVKSLVSLVIVSVFALFIFIVNAERGNKPWSHLSSPMRELISKFSTAKTPAGQPELPPLKQPPPSPSEKEEPDNKGPEKEARPPVKHRVARPHKSVPPVQQVVPPPPSPEYADLQFSFFTIEINAFPIKEATLPAAIDGTVAVEFTAGNIGNVTAKNGEMWMRICQACTFVTAPDGFRQLAGAPNQDREMSFERILPHIFLQKMTAKIAVPVGVSRFAIDFMYACETCKPPKGLLEPQRFFVNVTR